MKVSGKWHAELQNKRFDYSRAVSINAINLNVIIIINHHHQHQRHHHLQNCRAEGLSAGLHPTVVTVSLPIRYSPL